MKEYAPRYTGYQPDIVDQAYDIVNQHLLDQIAHDAQCGCHQCRGDMNNIFTFMKPAPEPVKPPTRSQRQEDEQSW